MPVTRLCHRFRNGATTINSCPFCQPDPARIFHRGRHVLGLWDAFPVSPGHALLVPTRHVATWFDANGDEQHELTEAIELAREIIEQRHRPDGFNVGFNAGESAGQTIDHLHLHVIPRYRGDVADPTGGVRHVVPAKANYLRAPELLGHMPHSRPLITGHDHDPLLPHLLAELDRASRVDIAVAFVMPSGVAALAAQLEELLDERRGRVRLLTGDYLDATDPDALLTLLDLPGDFELHVYSCAAGNGSKARAFHPKAYLFHHTDGSATAYIGSSNLSRSALATGVEWNYRVVHSAQGPAFDELTGAFETLLQDPATQRADQAWVQQYRERRRPPRSAMPLEIQPEPPQPVPEPHAIQKRALEALAGTRAAGYARGLVVLATGLGKTWLAAFDSRQFHRVLFVAHREEILNQAIRTFRRIRPAANLGRYTGKQQNGDADVLFASIQTLGKSKHLEQFARDRFDYIVVDEFHHAAAPTYRRLIDHFEPRFLLGLTATPERTDGGDLLQLCQENLVFRCDVVEGIQAQLLCPFHYYGVPDEVDYANIPWRSSRFDPEALTAAVATQERARNALEQYQRLAGQRTMAFCVSQKHADFMAQYFAAAGRRAVAVHAGPDSAPRATALEQLEAGQLDVVFAVDMFNEGVDLPRLDTVMMLRPTESPVVWMQQFGRGLRRGDDPEKRLAVIDYIGNHRTFLLKARTLLEPLLHIGAGNEALRTALHQLADGAAKLPDGCQVTYDLQAIEILKALLPPVGKIEALKAFYEEFRERHGQRPTAAELYHSGYNPGTLRKSNNSWLDFVSQMGDLSADEQQVLEQAGPFLRELERTSMSRSYKMLLLQSMLAENALPGSIPIEQLTARFARSAGRHPLLRSDVSAPLDDPKELRSLIEKNPIHFLLKSFRPDGRASFSYERDTFRTTFDLPSSLRAAFIQLTRELIDWRLAQYLDRPQHTQTDPAEIRCRVLQSNGRPILKLPDRATRPDIPHGWTTVLVDGVPHQANFAKHFINVLRPPDSQQNILPTLLRTFFGPHAGQPGTRFEVVLRREGEGYRLEPLRKD